MNYLIKNIYNQKIPLVGFMATLLVAVLYVYDPAWLEALDQKLYDTVLKNGHTTETKNVVAIVDLDEKSLKQYGQWPWPRYRLALLLKKLQQAEVRAVGMDIIFSEPDRSSPNILQQELKEDLDVSVEFSGLPEALKDNDRIFAQTLQDGPFVLGFFLEVDSKVKQDGPIFIKDINPALVTKDQGISLHDYLIPSFAALQPLENLSHAATATGFINTLRDQDGVLRSTPLIMSFKEKIYANLGFSLLWTSLGKPSCIVKYSSEGVESMLLGSTVIPLNKQGHIWLHYRGPNHTFPYYSAGDILAGNISAEALRGKIVLIGTTAKGLHDLRTTPFDSEYPGVEAHATLIDNILTGDFIDVPDWLPGLEFTLTILAGGVTTLLVCWLSAWFILPMILLFIGLCWFGSMWSFAQYHFYFSPLFPILSTGIIFSLLSFLKFLRSDQDKRFIRKAFSRYVSPKVVDSIVASPESLSLEGQDKEVSILFSDIRGFTTLSEKIPSTQLSALLKSYLTPMTRIIIEESGTLDKFIGDAVMAFWNAPVEISEHRYHAVSAGLAMLEALPALNAGFQEQYGLSLNIGIGIHAGRAIVGNMGSEDLFDYTVIGDNVNLASRLEGLTKFYGVPIIISNAMADVHIDGYTLQELDRVTVKGKDEPVSLFTLCKEELLCKGEMDMWNEALYLYRKSSFQDTIVILDSLLEERSTVYIYSLYRDRCQNFMVSHPGDDWDWVYCHDSK